MLHQLFQSGVLRVWAYVGSYDYWVVQAAVVRGVRTRRGARAATVRLREQLGSAHRRP